MARTTQRRIVAATLSMILPGAGQVYGGLRRRGLVLLGATAAFAAIGLALSFTGMPTLDRKLLAAVLAGNVVLLAFRLFAVVDAWRVAGGAATRAAVAALAAVAVVTALPHVAAGYVATRGYATLERVFADEEPRDVLGAEGVFLAAPLDPAAFQPPVEPPPESRPLAASAEVAGARAARPWTTILLLGSDEGPGNVGARTDTIILVALQHGTRRAAAFGVPRNLVDVAVGGKLKTFREPINGLYGFAREKPELFARGADPGATALKQAVSRLLGVRVDYYALANLRGFADLVDALGGVHIRVKERLVDEVTRPAWGEPKPRIDVVPGRTYHMYGRQALAYVRSRKDSDDYTRMARQRCFLSAMADQLDPFVVLRNFEELAETVETNIRTDIPLDRLPRLVKLVAALDSRETLTVGFGPEYFFGRRKSDNSPSPHVGRIRATVRATLLRPDEAKASGRVAVTRSAC